MDLKVFYSWQSDRENRLCRGFIAKAFATCPDVSDTLVPAPGTRRRRRVK